MFCKTFLVSLVLFLLSDSSDALRDRKFFRDDYTYIDAIDSFYKFHVTAQTWFTAKRMCDQEGASLYYPENDDEALAVGSFWNRTDLSGRYIFLGISDLLALGLYETVDGRPISDVHHNWSQGEPKNNAAKMRCVLQTLDGRMIVTFCETIRPFICKKSLQSLQWNYCCDTYDLDYDHNKGTNKCYKLHTTPLNWTVAYAVCRAEQSYLAVIDNQLEVDYLVNLVESTLKEKVEGNYFRGIFHLGFHNITHAGWRTVKGTPIYEDPAGWWGQNDAECGSMFLNGRLGKINCETKSFFICELEVGKSNFSLLETNKF